jgi:DNA-binding transcriptional MerR regulator
MAKHYTIQEAARITQVSVHTLRYYERIGLLHISRKENGHRLYSKSDLGWVRFVMLLRGTNMSLPEIAAFMRLEKDGQSTLDKRVQMLHSHRQELLQHIEALQSYLSALDAKIDYYRHQPAEICDCAAIEEENEDFLSSSVMDRYQKQSTLV